MSFLGKLSGYKVWIRIRIRRSIYVGPLFLENFFFFFFFFGFIEEVVTLMFN